MIDTYGAIEAAIDHLGQRITRFDADFKESEHPRDNDGKFTSGGGSSKVSGIKEKGTQSRQAKQVSYLPLSSEERAAVKEYQGALVNSEAGGFTNIQKMLREGKPSYPHAWDPEKGQAHIENLHKAFEKSVVTEPLTVYRGERAKRGEHTKYLNASVGDEVTDKGVTSTSTNSAVVSKFSKKLNPNETPVSLEFRLKPGTHALPVDDLVGANKEREIAVAPGTKFKVLSKRATASGIKLVLESIP